MISYHKDYIYTNRFSLTSVLEKSSRDIQELEDFCKEFTDNNINSPHAMGWLVDIYENRAKNGDEQAKEDAIKVLYKVKTF